MIGLEPVRAVALSLPDAHEGAAWVGTRWRVRGKTFAHLLEVVGGTPAGHARALGSDGPATVLMFRSGGPELDALRTVGAPFLAPVWRGDEVGLVVGGTTDWPEVAELVTES